MHSWKFMSRFRSAIVRISCPRRLSSVSAAMLLVAAMLAGTASAAPEGAQVQSNRSGSSTAGLRSVDFYFDIPAQALDSALDAYMRTTGVQLLYETALMSGLRSAQLNGQFEPNEALRILLMGTGLVARLTDSDTFSVVPAAALFNAVPVAPYGRDSRFVDALRASVVRALCGHAQTRPGAYKIAFELWIGQTGEVQSSALVGSTGDPLRDAALIKALQDVRVDEPPTGMPQPIVMNIRPRPPGDSRDCAER